ncbi:MAG: hypothetical protein R2874_01735 [Desulfobacterales bacterium]
MKNDKLAAAPSKLIPRRPHDRQGLAGPVFGKLQKSDKKQNRYQKRAQPEQADQKTGQVRADQAEKLSICSDVPTWWMEGLPDCM